MHVAMYDAVNAVGGQGGRYVPLVASPTPRQPASREAAAAAAAHTVLSTLMPGQKATFDAKLASLCARAEGHRAPLRRGAPRSAVPPGRPSDRREKTSLRSPRRCGSSRWCTWGSRTRRSRAGTRSSSGNSGGPTAIPNGDTDGSDATAPDPNWTPFLPTPNHPEYPAAHGCFTGGFVEVLRAYFGTDDVHVVVDSAPTGPSKSFDDVDDLKADIILGRIYGGMHYRNSMNVGQLVARYPRPVENLRRAIRELRTSSTAAISAGRSERSPYSRREGPSS